MTFEIASNIPIPNPQKGRRAKYPWRVMEVGDSFFVPDKKTNFIAGVAWHQKYRYGTEWTCRAENGGVRVWRTK